MAGFIGFHTAKRLAELGHDVYGIDNINDYYDTQLKHDRLNQLGIQKKESSIELKECQSSLFSNVRFKKVDLINVSEIEKIFKSNKFDNVCHMAAQAGVRYSIENPRTYIDSNINGFLNILEGCRINKVKHLLYASSSSVYGNRKNTPFKETDRVDEPISLYAASKKSNELMAYTYNHLFGFKTTGLRFFTVYGPWGRPDMALTLFADGIIKGKTIKVFNNGQLERDFTYIDDVVDGIIKLLNNSTKESSTNEIYNIGNGSPIKLMNFIRSIEKNLKLVAKKQMLPMQAGDVNKTFADTSQLKLKYNYQPNTPLNDGVKSFIDWYKSYKKLKN